MAASRSMFVYIAGAIAALIAVGVAAYMLWPEELPPPEPEAALG